MLKVLKDAAFDSSNAEYTSEHTNLSRDTSKRSHIDVMRDLYGPAS
jgi:hypothetical protein